MRQKLFLLATILLALSCNKSRILVDVHEIDFINKSDVTVKGSPLNVELPLGIRSLAVCDSFMIVMSGGKSDPQMNVYSDDWNILGRFCYRGRSRNEFINSPRMISKQTIKGDGGGTLIPLIDGIKGIKAVDIQRSLQSQSTVIATENDFESAKLAEYEDNGKTSRMRFSFNFILVDNNLNHTFRSYPQITMFGRVLFEPYYVVMYDTVQVKQIKFLSNVSANDDGYLYGSLFKHPTRNIIIQPLTYMDYILFFDLDNDKTFAIHQSGSLSFDDKLISEPEEVIEIPGGEVTSVEEKTTHFSGVACTESFFMVQYYAGDYSVNVPDIDKAAPELLFFDWNGNFLKSVKLDTPVDGITFDERKNILYGTDVNDRIIIFDLSTVVNVKQMVE